MNKETEYFVTYGADWERGNANLKAVGALSSRRCKDLVQALLENLPQCSIIILTAGVAPGMQDAVPLKKLMAQEIANILQSKGFLATHAEENRIDLYDNGKAVSIVTSKGNAWTTCNETIAMIEILKSFQDIRRVNVIATRCNWIRMRFVWNVFSDYPIRLSGSRVKRSARYYLMEVFKTMYDVGIGILYRLGIKKTA